jgi:hypothetical protein
MPRTEKQLQADYDKGKISLSEFHEALSKIGTARHAKEISKKKHRASMSSTKWFYKKEKNGN